jgi:predicted site-specific integrase-resolvase
MRKRLDIPPRNVWTVKEMADTLDVQYLTAKTWCTRRNIECEKLNNFLWVIPEKEVE